MAMESTEDGFIAALVRSNSGRTPSENGIVRSREGEVVRNLYRQIAASMPTSDRGGVVCSFS